MYQRFSEEKSIYSLLSEKSLDLNVCGKSQTCTCSCENSLDSATLNGWDNSCCTQQLDPLQSKESNLHTRSAPLLSCDKPQLTCPFLHSCNHELHIQQYRNMHKHYGNRRNYITTQIPLPTWNCSIPTMVKPRLVILSGNLKTHGSTSPQKHSKELGIPTESYTTRPSILRAPRPEHKTKLQLPKRGYKKRKDSSSHNRSYRNELSITAKPCYVDHAHRPYSEDARPPISSFDKQKMERSRLAALLQMRKQANLLRNQQYDNSTAPRHISYQTHYIPERSQPTSSSSAIAVMEPWIIFN
ncbi:uncharacterized protein [Dysidea avara]|uniref:uncharacterized protein isoform X2 n=1 Tax=Dysidea avara TaxID=196820 RepID=UPI00332FF323